MRCGLLRSITRLDQDYLTPYLHATHSLIALLADLLDRSLAVSVTNNYCSLPLTEPTTTQPSLAGASRRNRLSRSPRILPLTKPLRFKLVPLLLHINYPFLQELEDGGRTVEVLSGNLDFYLAAVYILHRRFLHGNVISGMTTTGVGADKPRGTCAF